MNILVTGGAGFIGSNFLVYMVNKYKKYNFICLDALTYSGNLNNIEEVMNKKNFKFIKGNICNKKLLDKIFFEEAIDIVVNFAAETHNTKSITKPNIFIKTNVYGTLNLLEESKKYNIKRFHQISTDEVYGSFSGKPFKENDKLNPSTPYAVSKASADLLVLSYGKNFNLPITISRSSNNYGPKQHMEKFIPLAINNILNNKLIPIHNKGEHIRDWIYVLDHVKAIDKILHRGRLGEIYNISSNVEKTSLDVAKVILKCMNKSIDLIKYIPDRIGNDIHYSINSDKIINELSWNVEMDFLEGIGKTIIWYENKIKEQ